MRSRFFLRAVVVAALVTGHAAAQNTPSAADIAQARDLGGQAQAAFEASNFAESEKLWTAAQKIYPAPTLTLGLARTQVKLGRLVLAHESYQKIIREQGSQANLTPAFADALAAAKSEIEGVNAKLANVVITVDGASNPTVTLDDQPVSAGGLGLKRPVDPGQHTVKAEAPGFQPATTTFQVGEAGLAEAKLHLEKAGDAPPTGTGPAPVTNNTVEEHPVVLDSKKSSRKTLAYVAWGVGGAGLVFGAITGLLAIGKHGDLADKCTGDKCPSAQKSDIDSYKTMGTLSTVGFIVAGAGVAVGTVFFLTAPKSDAKAALAPRVVPYVGASGGGVVGRF